MFKLIQNILITALALYIGVLAYYTYQQRTILYRPQQQTYVPPSEVDTTVAFQEFPIRTEDGFPLKGWYAPATKKKLTVVFFHGNADSLATSAPLAEPYVEAGYGFLLAEYRGYSGLPGEPDENGLYRDGRAFIAKLFDQGVDTTSVVFMGHSLGTGVAVQMAKEFHPAGLALLAPFRSIPKIAEKLFPYLPTDFLVFDRFDNEDKMPLLQNPVLVVHGDHDAVVPLSHGQRVFDRAQQPKSLKILEGLGHNDMFPDAAPLVLDWLDDLDKNG